MGLTLHLPQPLERELTEEATRDGLSPSEQATLLLYVTTALLKEDLEAASPFQRAVHAFLSTRSLDAKQVATVLEDLVRACAALVDSNKGNEAFHHALAWKLDKPTENPDALLSEWRSEIVHGLSPADHPGQTPGPVNRRPSVLGKYSGLGVSSDEFAKGKKAEIAREERHSE